MIVKNGTIMLYRSKWFKFDKKFSFEHFKVHIDNLFLHPKL